MTSQREPAKLIVEAVRCADPFFAYRVAGLVFPLRDEALHLVTTAVQQLIAATRDTTGLQPTLWLDLQQLHRDGGSKLFSSNARKWSPSPGFCFDPTLSPQRSFDISDFMNLQWGTQPRIDDRTAMRVSKSAATDDAYQLMAGRGLSVMLFFQSKSDPEQEAERYARYTREHLRSYMAPDNFQSFDFYLPLLHTAAVVGADSTKLDSWMGSAVVYLREAEEHGELILLSRVSLHQLLSQLTSARLLADTPQPQTTTSP